MPIDFSNSAQQNRQRQQGVAPGSGAQNQQQGTSPGASGAAPTGTQAQTGSAPGTGSSTNQQAMGVAPGNATGASAGGMAPGLGAASAPGDSSAGAGGITSNMAQYYDSQRQAQPALGGIEALYQDLLGRQDKQFMDQQNLLNTQRGNEKRAQANIASRMGGGLGAGFNAGQRQADINATNQMSQLMLNQGDQRRAIELSMLDNRINEKNRNEAWAREDKNYAQQLQDQRYDQAQQAVQAALLSGDPYTIEMALNSISSDLMTPELQALREKLGNAPEPYSDEQGFTEDWASMDITKRENLAAQTGKQDELQRWKDAQDRAQTIQQGKNDTAAREKALESPNVKTAEAIMGSSITDLLDPNKGNAWMKAGMSGSPTGDPIKDMISILQHILHKPFADTIVFGKFLGTGGVVSLIKQLQAAQAGA